MWLLIPIAPIRNLKYHQGMHELLAPLVYVFYTEYKLVTDVASTSSELMRNVMDFTFLEHDLYWMYSKLLEHTRLYYHTDAVKVITIHYTTYYVHRTSTSYTCTVYTVQCAPGVANLWPVCQMWPFSKKLWPFLNPEEQKKVIKEKFGRVGKKVWVDGPQQKRFLIFPFFGPPTTEGWRPLVYTVQYTPHICNTLYTIQYTMYYT